MIDIKNLNVFYKDKKLLRELDFGMSEGKFIGITGASGSGKSLFAKSLIRLFDDKFRVRADKFSIYKKDILKLSQNELKEHRKKVAALIFQNSVASLHPLLNVGDHFNAYLGGDNKTNKELAFAYFREFGLGNANLIWHKYSYELSGGEASRVQIALALCLKPKILICDEITSGLDSISGSHVAGILESLKGKMSVIFISHDEALTNYLSDEIWQMRDGRLNLKENA
ncbi:ATP-binding cassette domain-containing protein [Campylobacter concisus]|uniref:Putative peptide ABC-transport system ATP-binding protein n=1 Tax=Campylobacter concisus UNSW2 TaxID=1242965 RepID=U2FL77_9BACT|nr:ATP-binding cassette domain-containing protein [Campylobacter concisus]ERJ31125.1 Putative peptide ABC-transport system ATP-binding protein [Campylobacter concisus UNSW2]